MSYGPHTHNPVEHDESPLDEDRIPCGCGDSRCRLDPNDSTNVLIKGTWFSADCAGLCFLCGEVDDLNNLYRTTGSWLTHEGCQKLDQQITAELERDARRDERVK